MVLLQVSGSHQTPPRVYQRGGKKGGKTRPGPGPCMIATTVACKSKFPTNTFSYFKIIDRTKHKPIMDPTSQIIKHAQYIAWDVASLTELRKSSQ